MLLLSLVLALSVGFSVWAFAGSSLGTVGAGVGALGAALVGLTVFGRVRRGTLGKGVVSLVGAQFVYLALWIAGGVLWSGPPRSLPHFASPLRLTLAELQGRWTREDGRVYEVRGAQLCPTAEPREAACSPLDEDGRGRLSLRADDVWLPVQTYRRWGREILTVDPFGWTFTRSVSER